MNSEEHISQNDLLNYILRNEYEAGNIDTVVAHLEKCTSCRERCQLFQSRYQNLEKLPKPEEHIRQLKQKMENKPKIFILPWYVKAAAGFAFLFIIYGSAAWWMNYRFDHSEAGLAVFQKDYEYALEEVHYRGDGFKERNDIKEFKKGVRLLFEAKETALGLFPGYNEEKILEAEKYFGSTFAQTKDELLKRKITDYRKKVGLMKKEIKK